MSSDQRMGADGVKGEGHGFEKKRNTAGWFPGEGGWCEDFAEGPGR